MYATDEQEYRAAYVGNAVLTGPEHQHLSDQGLVDEAMAESERMELGLQRDQIRIGIWREHRPYRT